MHELSKVLDNIERRKQAVLARRRKHAARKKKDVAVPAEITISQKRKRHAFLHPGEDGKYNKAPREATFFVREKTTGDVRLFSRATNQPVRRVETKVAA